MIEVVVAAASGVLTWTLLEYVIHRWGGHDRRYRRTPFGKEHLQHHVIGDYFAPTITKVAVAAVVTAVGLAITCPLIGTAAGTAYVAGLIAFYAVYEWFHRRQHTHAGVGWYGRWARRHHFRHHLVDARTNFGVTTPLWDVVFGTYRTATRIAVPPRLAMAWLLDPTTGQVRAQHAGTYELRSR